MSEQEFWECVSSRNPPKHRFGEEEPPAAALPAQLVHQLIHDLGVPMGEIVDMTVERATELMIAYWSKPQD